MDNKMLCIFHKCEFLLQGSRVNSTCKWMDTDYLIIKLSWQLCPTLITSRLYICNICEHSLLYIYTNHCALNKSCVLCDDSVHVSYFDKNNSCQSVSCWHHPRLSPSISPLSGPNASFGHWPEEQTQTTAGFVSTAPWLAPSCSVCDFEHMTLTGHVEHMTLTSHDSHRSCRTHDSHRSWLSQVM